MIVEHADVIFRGLGAKTVIRDLEQIGVGGKKAADGIKTLQIAAQRARFELVRAFSLLAIVGTITKAIGVMAKFSDAIQTIRAVAKTSGSELEALKNKAMELGKSTVFTASEVADAMVVLARTGASTADILNQIGPALNLARAGGLGLAAASDIMVSTLAQFNLTVADSGRVADVLTTGANQAKTSVQEIASALTQVGKIANDAGMSLEETVAILGVLANSSLTASKGGTGLKNVFTNMVNPVGKSGEALHTLGLTIDDLKTSGGGLVKALKKLSGANLRQAFQIFKKLGATSFLAIKDNIPQIEKFTRLLIKSGGSAKEAAKVMDHSLGAAITRVGSALENLALSFKEIENATSAFDLLSSSINFISDNLKTAGVFAFTFVATLTSGLVLRIVRVIFGISRAMNILTISMKVATLAARTLFRSLLIGIVVEALVNSIDKVGELNDKLRKTKKKLTGLDIVKNIGKGFVLGTVDVILAINDLAAALIASIVGVVIFIGGVTVKLISNVVDVLGSKIGGMIFDLKKKVNGILGSDIIRGVALNAGIILPKKAFDVSGGRPTDGVTSTTSITSGVINAGKKASKTTFGVATDLVNKAFKGIGSSGPSTADKAKERAITDKKNKDAAKVLKDRKDKQASFNLANAQFLKDLEQERVLSTKNAIERTALAKVNRLVNKSIKDLVPIQGKELTALIKTTIAAEKQIDVNKRRVAILEGLRKPNRDLIRDTKILGELFKTSEISAGQYARALRDINLTAAQTDQSFSGQLKTSLLTYSKELDNIGTLAGGTIVNGFKNAENALVNFVTTGKLSFKSLINSMIADLARLLIRQAIIAPLFKAIGGSLGNLFNFGGTTGAATSNFGPAATNNAFITFGTGGGLTFDSSIGSTFGTGGGLTFDSSIGSTFGAAHGASFMVGGMGGTDSQLVQFRATPNERVTIETPGQRGRNGGGGGVTIINNIDAKGAEIGVEAKIVNAIANAAPLIVNKSRSAALNDTREMLTRRRL